VTVAEITGLISALTALIVAIGGVITAIKVLREVKTGNQLTKTGNSMTGSVHKKLNKQKLVVEKYQHDVLTALQSAGVTIPDEEGENGNAVPDEKER
jgi:hypothetical protein